MGCAAVTGQVMRSQRVWSYRELSLAHRWLKSLVYRLAAVPSADMTA
jgi:hypothetical protein